MGRLFRTNKTMVMFAIFSMILFVQMANGRPGKKCPWDNPDLALWSDPATWSPGPVPGENDKVVIPAGMQVLLDISPPSLSTITVEHGASIVWGDVDEITLRVHYILVYGEFHIGSESCRFEKKARIQLIGQSNTDHRIDEDDFGTKAIFVAYGGVLELHGEHKTSWTRLAQTIPAANSVPCGFVYNHAKNPFSEERQEGLHVMVWDEDGSVFGFQVFKKYDSFSNFFGTVPVGKVIAILGFGSDGLVNKHNSAIAIAKVTSVITELGGAAISKVQKGDSYSFIARRGDPMSVREYHKSGGQNDPAPYCFLHLTDEEHDLDFQVAASSAVAYELFRVQRLEAANPILTFADEVTGWDVGDQIVVASTDFDWRQAEVRTIVDCGGKCSPRQVRVNESFYHLHYGNFTYNVDERAEVGILSRSIVIEGVLEQACYSHNKDEQRLCEIFKRDTFGGQVRVVKGFAAAHVEGVELYHMGQQNRLGGYPLHFHMTGETPGQWFRDNSIHHSFSRCVTMHGCHQVEVSGNVCYDFLGHGFFVEDGVEQNIIVDRNLGIGAQHSTLLMSDMTKDWCAKSDKIGSKFTKSCDELSVFWVTHPNNQITNNAAAGGDGHGYMFVFADLPLGMSYDLYQQMGWPNSSRFYPLKKFENNTGHSHARMGLFMDSKISTGKLKEEDGIPMNGIIQSQNFYDPRDPPNENGRRVWTEMRRLTFYKNKENMWLKGGNVRVAYSSFADAPEGFGGGTTGTETGTEVSHSIFIGETDNLGEPQTKTIQTETKKYIGVNLAQSFADGDPTSSLTALSMYQGPNFIKSTYFDRYPTRRLCMNDGCTETITRYAGAVSWKRDNTYPTMTPSFVQDLKFGFCDGDHNQHWVFHGNSSTPSWEEEDGNKAAYVRDADGSLTGSPNAALVRNFPLYKGDQCLDRPDWGMSVCPYRYIKMEILGEGGSLSQGKREQTPLFIRRDDKPYDEFFEIQGTIRNEYLLRTHRSYLLDFNTDLAGAAFPEGFIIYGYGVEKGDVVRVGICQPTDVDYYQVRSDYPATIRNDATWVDNLKDLDADETGSVFFYDRKNGILYFKILSHHYRTNDSQRCPDGQCFKISFTPVGGDLKSIRTCMKVTPQPFVDNTPVPATPTPRKCNQPDSPEGLGAVSWPDVGFISLQDFSVPCTGPVAPAGRKPMEYLGCYVAKIQTELQDNEYSELAGSMTPQWCADRCYKRNYRYSALLKGNRCTCSNILNTADTDDSCNKPCSGNKTVVCGGNKSMAVFSTGKE